MMYSYRRWNQKIRPFLYVLSLLVVPCTAQAGFYENGLDFSLTVASSKTQWTYNNVERETRVNSITALWSKPLTDSIRGSLKVAYLDSSQSSHPQPVGLDTTGNAVGIGLRMRLIDASAWRMYLRFGYDYASTDNELGGQKIENEWTTTTAGVDAIFAPRNNISLLAGAGLASVDGEEQLTGPINQVTTFEEDDSVAYYGGLSIKTDRRGRIGLRWYGGTSEGFVMNFSRSF